MLLIASSCSNERDPNQEVKALNETPEVLNNESGLNLSSRYGKRLYKSDIIQQLFEEALTKDETLRSINKRISETDNLQRDSLEAFEIYTRNNENYWRSLGQYANMLNDTILRDELKIVIDSLHSKYLMKLSPIDSLVSQIESNKKLIRDQEVLMKMLVTIPMIRNYQYNELPDSNRLKSVKQRFDTLIMDMRPYTKIRDVN